MRYVSAQTSVKVLRIAASATTSGSSTAGSVPNTNSRITSAPTRADRSPRSAPPSRRPTPLLLASPSASRPVTLTSMPAGRPFAAAARIVSAPLGTSSRAGPGRVHLGERRVPVGRHVRRGCRSRSRSWSARPGIAAATRSIAWPIGGGSSSRRRWCGRRRRSGLRAPAPRAASVRWLASYAGLPGTARLWYQRVDTWPAAKAPNRVSRARRRSSASGGGRSGVQVGSASGISCGGGSGPITHDPAFASGRAGTIG